MPIADIIREIDAHLLSLRLARKLLSAPLAGMRRKRTDEGNRTETRKQAASTPSSNSSMVENKSGSDRKAPEGKTRKQRTESIAETPRPPAPPAANLKQSLITVTEPAQPPALDKDALVPKEKESSVKVVRRSKTARPGKTALRGTPNEIKPAIALAGSLNSRIVVVSAKQAQQERDRAAHTEAPRPRARATGLTGRLAFEALFNDAGDSSKSSGQ